MMAVILNILQIGSLKKGIKDLIHKILVASIPIKGVKYVGF
jgi:hypothetical protein